MSSWAYVNTFGIPVGIWAVRKGIQQYQSLRRTYNTQRPSITPLSSSLSFALNVLFWTAVVSLFSTVPYFHPPNIFLETRSRFQATTEVIFARLAALRDLTPIDLALKPLLATKEGRLFYLKYGPSVLTSCQFCISNNGEWDNFAYFVYALPSLLGPHLAHFAVVGAVTSPFLSGTAMVTRFRTPALLATVALAVGELYLTYTHGGTASVLSTRIHEMDLFYWRARVLRGIAFAALDAVLGSVIWLAGTNRFFIGSPGTAQRMLALSQALHDGNWRLWSTGHLRNVNFRDSECRQQLDAYWTTDKEVYEQREVVDAIRVALERANMPQIEQNAEQGANGVVNAIKTIIS